MGNGIKQNIWLAVAVAIAGLAGILYGGDIRWQREYAAIVNGEYVPDAYSEGLGWPKPAFVDIDSDGDYDMFVGERKGNINFYRNDGTSTSLLWTFITDSYNSINVGYGAVPTFCDIDNDGDYDMFVGNESGTIHFYQNNGTPNSPLWTLVTRYFASVNVSWYSTPTFCDIDNDGDYDLFIGTGEARAGGPIYFYRNDGTPTLPLWTFITDDYNSISVGWHSSPTFCDIDNDGDYDLFVGGEGSSLNFYRNDGIPSSPLWTFITPNYNSIDTEGFNTVGFCDIDADGDYDMFVGDRGSKINFYRNDGTPTSPSWLLVPGNFNNSIVGGIDVGTESTPEFCDIDNDGDYDMFVGHGYLNSGIYFFRNDGTPEVSNWKLVTENYDSIVTSWFNTPEFCDIDNDGDSDLFVGHYEEGIHFYRNDGTPEAPDLTRIPGCYTNPPDSACTFCDIDKDGDYDMFVLEEYCQINFYRNDGTPEVPDWTLVTGDYFTDFLGEHITTLTVPTFHDIDNDGDYDMFVSEKGHHLRFYRNVGTPEVPDWILVTENYNSIDVERFSTLRFCDIDDDGDYDMFMGEGDGGISFWRNMTTEGPRNFYVDDNAPNDPGPGDPAVSDPLEDGTKVHPFDAIQEAIDSAASGDTVLVAPGVYNEYVIMKDGVNLQGAGAEVTMIDGRYTMAVVTGANNCRLDGFTIIGDAHDDIDGVYCQDVEDFTISHNIIKSNSWSGVNLYSSSPLITNNIISGNICAGIMCRHGSSPIIVNNTITDNLCEAGINSWSNSSPLIVNNIITNNIGYGGIYCWEGSATILYNNVWKNSSRMHGPIDFVGCEPREGNLCADPLFADPNNNDYHLLPDSPCIDVGDPNYIAEPNETDLDGMPRVIGGRIDMGAYEAPIPAEARIIPRTINLASKGNWLTCYIRLPEEYSVTDIEPNSIFLEDEIKPEHFSVDEEQQVVMARFSRSEVQAILKIGRVNLTVSGLLSDGTVFEGSDVITVIDKGSMN